MLNFFQEVTGSLTLTTRLILKLFLKLKLYLFYKQHFGDGNRNFLLEFDYFAHSRFNRASEINSEVSKVRVNFSQTDRGALNPLIRLVISESAVSVAYGVCENSQDPVGEMRERESSG